MARRRRRGVSGSFSTEFVSTNGRPPEDYFKKMLHQLIVETLDKGGLLVLLMKKI